MHLENLGLRHFKNFEKLELTLSPRLNCFIGKNGSGKTNLLDSIHYLCLTKSAFNHLDQQNIRHGQESLWVRGEFNQNQKKTTVTCQYQPGRKKTLSIGRKKMPKLRDYIGQFPVILIAPNDTDLVREGAEFRRRFLDSFLAQLDNAYLADLLKYNRTLKQRNGLLEDFFQRGYFDKDLLSSFDQVLLDYGQKIFARRTNLLTDLIPATQDNYDLLSSGGEAVSITYRSELDRSDYPSFFQSRLEIDLASRRTSAGIHRDDLLFSLDDHPVKRFGSQGQQKSFVLALKLAQYKLTADRKRYPPILLLDDIFDKLDDTRIARLFEIVTLADYGQLFVTDAGDDRLPLMIEKLSTEAKIFRIENQIPVLIN